MPKNKSKKILLLICLLLVETCTLTVSGFFILKKFNHFPSAKVTQIPKESIILEPTDQLKYFLELSPNYDNNYFPDWLGYKPVFRINKDGLNTILDYPLEKESGHFRIITLGDSWTFGQFVNTKNNYSSVLEETLNKNPCGNSSKFEVINLGVPSYDIRYSVERYKIRGQKYQPDLVVWLLIKNDFDEINEYIQPLADKYFREEGIKAPTHINSFNSVASKVWQKAIDTQNKQLGEKGVRNYEFNSLKLLRTFYQGKLVIMTLNNVFSFNKWNTDMLDDFSKLDKNIYYFKNNVKLFDNEFLQDGHPNNAGHAKIASSLHSYLLQNGLIKCNN